MSALIEAYHNAKKVAERVSKIMMKAVGTADIQNNPGIRFSEHKIGFTPELTLYVTFRNLGEYIGSDRLHEAREYFIKALNEQAPNIASRACNMAREDREQARHAARAEAEEILKEVA